MSSSLKTRSLLFLGVWLGTHSKVSLETMLQLKHKIWVATNLCICLKKLNSVSGCCNCSMVVKIKSFVLIAHSRINKKGAFYVVENFSFTLFVHVSRNTGCQSSGSKEWRFYILITLQNSHSYKFFFLHYIASLFITTYK